MFLSSRKYDLGCSSRIRILLFYPSRIPDIQLAPDRESETLVKISRTGPNMVCGDTHEEQECLQEPEAAKWLLLYAVSDRKMLWIRIRSLYCKCSEFLLQSHYVSTLKTCQVLNWSSFRIVSGKLKWINALLFIASLLMLISIRFQYGYAIPGTQQRPKSWNGFKALFSQGFLA
jgi:hypothetical protein